MDLIHEALFVSKLMIQARGLTMPKNTGDHIQDRRVRTLEPRNRKTKGEMRLVDVFLQQKEPGGLLQGFFGKDRLVKASLWKVAHKRLDLVDHCFILQVADNHDGEIFRVVMFFYVGENVVPGDRADALFRAADRQPVRMDGIGLGHELQKEFYGWSVVAHPDLFQDYQLFPRKLFRIKNRMKNRIGQDR